jgi:hypothetical protein
MSQIRAVYDRNLVINGRIRPVYGHRSVEPGPDCCRYRYCVSLTINRKQQLIDYFALDNPIRRNRRAYSNRRYFVIHFQI